MLKSLLFVIFFLATLVLVHTRQISKHEWSEDTEEEEERKHIQVKNHHHHQKDPNSRGHNNHRKRNKEENRSNPDSYGLGDSHSSEYNHNQAGKWALSNHKHNQDGVHGGRSKKEHRIHRHDNIQEKGRYERLHHRQNKQDRKFFKHGNKERIAEKSSKEMKQPVTMDIHTEKSMDIPNFDQDSKTKEQTTPLPVQTSRVDLVKQLDKEQVAQSLSTISPTQIESKADNGKRTADTISSICKSHAECQAGACCNMEKGKCQDYKVLSGQKCWDTCACSGGLLCFMEGSIKDGQNRENKIGVCKAPDSHDLENGIYLKQ